MILPKKLATITKGKISSMMTTKLSMSIETVYPLQWLEQRSHQFLFFFIDRHHRDNDIPNLYSNQYW